MSNNTESEQAQAGVPPCGTPDVHYPTMAWAKNLLPLAIGSPDSTVPNAARYDLMAPMVFAPNSPSAPSAARTT